MTKLKRCRPAPTPEPEPAPTGPRLPQRLQDVMADLTPRFVGVDPECGKRALEAYMRNEHGELRPYCTHVNGSYTFDPQYGCYVHSDPKCWKPSKAMYEACLRAGILGELKVKQ